jgi:hypothetical protein
LKPQEAIQLDYSLWPVPRMIFVFTARVKGLCGWATPNPNPVAKKNCQMRHVV